MEPLGVKPNTKVSIKHLHGDRISVKDYLGNVKEPRWHRVVRSGLYLVIECGGGECGEGFGPYLNDSVHPWI